LWPKAKVNLYSQMVMLKIILLTILFSLSLSLSGQSQEKVLAALIVKLARSTQWPSESNSNFVIGVMSYSPLADEIRSSVTSLKKGNRTILVREIASPDETTQCDLVFIPSFKSKALTGIIQALHNKPVMLITNKIGLTQAGSTVNITLVEGKIQFEYSPSALNKIGLKMPTEVKNLGKAAL
jgi:YfiR/HmsC-like